MEKTLQICGRYIKFKCTAGTLIRYRNQFNCEFLADLGKLQNIKITQNYEDITLAPIENIIWVMAKTADDSIPDPLTWYDSFDEFPLIDVFNQLQDILIASIKIKNSTAAVTHQQNKQRKRRNAH